MQPLVKLWGLHHHAPVAVAAVLLGRHMDGVRVGMLMVWGVVLMVYPAGGGVALDAAKAAVAGA